MSFYTGFVYFLDQDQLGYWTCDLKFDTMQWLIISIKNTLLVNSLPLPILITLQVATYRAIMKSAQQFQLTLHRIRTMKQIRKTFFIVILAFFLPIFPAAIFYPIVYSILHFNPSMVSGSFKLPYRPFFRRP